MILCYLKFVFFVDLVVYVECQVVCFDVCLNWKVQDVFMMMNCVYLGMDCDEV